jgi:hypothetical protein
MDETNKFFGKIYSKISKNKLLSENEWKEVLKEVDAKVNEVERFLSKYVPKEKQSENVDDPKLTKKQLVTINAILATPTYEKAIKMSKVSRSTFYRWLKEDNFKNEMERQCALIAEDNLKYLKKDAGTAISTLRGLLNSNSDKIKFQAATKFIEYVLQSRSKGSFKDGWPLIRK